MTGAVSGFITDEVALNIVRDHEPVAHFARRARHFGHGIAQKEHVPTRWCRD